MAMFQHLSPGTEQRRSQRVVPRVQGQVRELLLPNGARAAEGKMPTQTLDPTLQEFLRGRYIATLGTESADGTIHLTAVWYLFEDGYLFVATSSKSRKVRNMAARPKASVRVDVRKPGAVRGVIEGGSAEWISSAQSREITRCMY